MSMPRRSTPTSRGSRPRRVELDKKTIADWLKGLEVSDLVRKPTAIQICSANAVANENASYLECSPRSKGAAAKRYWTDSEVQRCDGDNDQLAKRLAEAIGQDNIRLKKAVRTCAAATLPASPKAEIVERGSERRIWSFVESASRMKGKLPVS